MTALWIMLALAPAGALACLLLKDSPWARHVVTLACAGTFVCAVSLAIQVERNGALHAANGWLQIDSLSALIALIVTSLGTLCAWYAGDYMVEVRRHDENDAHWAPGRYEALYLGLMSCMIVSVASNNLGLLWVSVEGSTLSSALLVGYYRRPSAVEAGWKYLILSSVGITLALLATVLLFYSSVHLFGEGGAGLQWTALREVAAQLDPRFVRLAFLFALCGYGAKAGLAPMHSWLPDAYSQAPTPAAALMSTALLSASLTALLRFHAITAACVGAQWPDGLLTLFGIFSLVVALPFLLVQGEYKRLLAYSSLEHTGIVTLAIGFGTPLSVFAGLLHLIVQCFGKALAYLVGGSFLRATHSRRMDHWSGALEAAPSLGVLLAGGGIALMGLPPAGTFLSEWFILMAGFASTHHAVAVGALVALVFAFIGLSYHWTRMLLGRPRAGFADALPARAQAPMYILLAVVLVLGFALPQPLRALIEHAAGVLRP